MKFEIGDRVICIDNTDADEDRLIEGDEYLITGIDDTPYAVLSIQDKWGSDLGGWCGHRFQKKKVTNWKKYLGGI